MRRRGAGFAGTDTVKEIDSGARIVRTVDRSVLQSVQTPQVFRFSALWHAYTSEFASLNTATDDAGLVEACNYDVRVFPGQMGNFKVTTEYDLELARILLTHRQSS